MHRRPLLQALDHYEQTWVKGLALHRSFRGEEEQRHVSRLRDFVISAPDCFQRTHLAGHITGSALIVSPDLRRVLLTLHRKLGKWLQLGGHADGENDVAAVALREAQEESGLSKLHFRPLPAIIRGTQTTPVILDIDVHEIPERKSEPTHFHYDIRFLIEASGSELPRINEESTDLAWHIVEDAYALNVERSMERQFDKLQWIASSR
jgi:8-oxo-dGTP pyrophosphatase MutT (NUDIX family)